jgi:hypothetical protein
MKNTLFPIIIISLTTAFWVIGCSKEQPISDVQPPESIECPDKSKEMYIETDEGRMPDLGSPYRFPNLVVSGSVIQDAYLPGEDIVFELFLHNAYGESVTISDPPEISITKPQCKATREDCNIIRILASGSDKVVLEHDECLEYKLTWNQLNDDGEQVVRGYYRFLMTEKAFTTLGEKADISSESFDVFLQYPQGAMLKVINVNQSKIMTDYPLVLNRETILTDLTITLDKISSRDTSSRFQAMVTLPEYPWEGMDAKYPSYWMPYARGKYVIDGIEKDAGSNKQSFQESGIRWVWGTHSEYNVDPFPSDAEELTFIITISYNRSDRLADAVQKSFEFIVPIE